MSDLTEFLLARIAEDEATFRWGRLVPDSDDAAYDVLRWDDERGRVECEAKRRIVDHFTSSCEWSDGGVEAVAHFAGFKSAMEFVLLKLAEPYSDHPDFDTSWRTD